MDSANQEYLDAVLSTITPDAVTVDNAGLKVLDTGGDHTLAFTPSENLSADRTLSISVNNANRTLTVNSSTTLGGGTHSGTNTGDQTSIVGITGTKSQFDTACSDGNFLYTSDCPTVTFADAANIAVNTTTGTKIGTATSQKLGFFNATPVTQRTNITAITDNTGSAATNSIEDTGNSTANANDATLCDRINKIEQILQDLGLTS